MGSGWLDQQGQLRSFDAAVDLLGVRHPLHQLLWRGQFEKQMSKYLLRAIDEEFVLPVGGSLEERGSDRSSFSAPDKLLRRSPIGAPAVQRIEHNIAAAFVVKTLDEFAGWVMDNGGVSTRLNLTQHLQDDGRFAAAGIADDLEMLILGALRNTQHLAASIHFEADARPFEGFVKLPRRHENRPLEASPVLHLLATANVLWDGQRKLPEQRECSEDKRPLEQINDACSAVDLLLEVASKSAVLVDVRSAAIEIDHAVLASGVG